MIDMHSHSLPGVDDGAKTIRDSLSMLSMAKQQGVTLVAATPHCITDREEGVAEFVRKRQAAYEALKKAIEEDGGDYPDVIYGAEVYLGCDISEFSNLHDLCYQNTDYILLEMPSGYSCEDLSEWIYNISTKGLRPVIAHVDRYSRYKQFMDEFNSVTGMVYQINASEFETMASRRLVKSILKRHDRIIVSSDMHNCTTRPCNMLDAYNSAMKKFPKYCDMLFKTGAECIVNNAEFRVKK